MVHELISAVCLSVPDEARRSVQDKKSRRVRKCSPLIAQFAEDMA
jgi:hypothetical protein